MEDRSRARWTLRHYLVVLEWLFYEHRPGKLTLLPDVRRLMVSSLGPARPPLRRIRREVPPMLRRETLAALAVETLLHASAADEPAISAAELELWERLVEQVDAAGCQPEALRSELLLEQVRAAARLAPACAGAAPRAGAAH